MTFPFASRPGRELMGGSLTNVEGGGRDAYAHIDSPPRPTAVGSPVCAMKFFCVLVKQSKCVSSY